MRTSLFTVSLAFLGVSVAFPTAPNNLHDGSTGYLSAAAHGKRQIGSTTFNPAKQKIDVTGEHKFIAPGPNDQRGPCPGLNAMANHGYIDRTGVTTLTEATRASQKIFGLGPDAGLIFSTLALIYGGDPITQRFSIGGPVPGLAVPPLIVPPPGLSRTHNKMEGDASPTRSDAYANNGDASSLSLEHFKHLYDLVPEGSSTGFDAGVMIQHRMWTRERSISTNPHYFVAPVGSLAVATLTHSFVPIFYSNHSAEHPEGILGHEVLKLFYGVSGNSQNLTYQKGHERIPDNWYRRPDDYFLPAIIKVLVELLIAHPKFASLGGNTGVVNSFAGLDPSDLTGGVYNSANLLQGNNLICFILQATQPGLTGVVPNPLAALELFKAKIGPILGQFGCPELARFNTAAFDAYPGAKGGRTA